MSATVLPSVGVVVPTVDRPAELARAVRAIVEQDYDGDIEVLICFDGMEPVRPEVDVPPRRSVTLLQNSRTKGLAGNRNTGYAAATTDLLATCDDDDEWLPGKLAAQAQLLQSRPDATVIGTATYMSVDGVDKLRLPSRPELTRRDLLLHREVTFNSSTFLWRRKDIARFGLIDEQLPGSYGEDYEWLLRAASFGPLLCVPTPLTRIYWHRTSYFAGKWETIDAALRHLLEVVPDFATEPRGLGRIEGQLAFANAALGRRQQAARWMVRALRHKPTAKHAWAALPVLAGVLSPDRVLELARRSGRGL